jgi:hypothetical protein
MMSRREKLLRGVNLPGSVGVEIGALCRPFLSRDDGEVIYVDHADTDTLRSKYLNDPDVQLDKLVHVDAVWGSNTLFEAIGKKVDYVVASHVVEHVPDLIGWLKELSSILKENGEVRLIVPDKRFTYDYLRHKTRLPEVIYAHLIKARVPQPHVILEYVMNVVKLDGGLAWRGKIDEVALEHHHSMELAEQCALKALRDGTYQDIHCWVFTPRSFSLLLAELAERGLIAFECTNFFDTAPDTNEFFIGMRPAKNAYQAAQGWRNIAASAIDVRTADDMGEELKTVSQSRTWRLTSRLIKIKSLIRRLMRG